VNRTAASHREPAATPVQPVLTETDIGNLAHELANPLNAIAITTHLAKRMLARGDSAAAAEALNTIGADCDRCARLLRDAQEYLSLAIHRPRDTVDLAAMLDEVSQPLRVRGEVAIHASNACRVEGDAPALRRLFREVLCNAFDHGAHRVSVDLECDGSEVNTRISDDGPGIDPALRARIFDAFYSTQRQHHSGTGLAVARSIAQAHRGDIEIEDAGRGAVFRVTLPV
jgi:signal transduction histidine kinase